uniref:Uncharacterized protein n=1 Tax=Arundo donax TaxID=35708 RepID=A0A0A9HCX3_ARUDO
MKQAVAAGGEVTVAGDGVISNRTIEAKLTRNRKSRNAHKPNGGIAPTQKMKNKTFIQSRAKREKKQGNQQSTHKTKEEIDPTQKIGRNPHENEPKPEAPEAIPPKHPKTSAPYNRKNEEAHVPH